MFAQPSAMNNAAEEHTLKAQGGWMPCPDTEKSNEKDPRGTAPSSVLFENAHLAPIFTVMRLSFNQGSLQVDTLKRTWTRETSKLRHTACSMCPLGTMQPVRQRSGSAGENACPRRGKLPFILLVHC